MCKRKWEKGAIHPALYIALGLGFRIFSIIILGETFFHHGKSLH